MTVQEAATLQSYVETEQKEVFTGLVALDLFAGTGWGVACRWLGIAEFGVDNMQEVIDTRNANGMSTIFSDVWSGIGPKTALLSTDALHVLQNYNLLIASPPCQSFSVAGTGAGRQALDQVIAAIKERRYERPEDLYNLGAETDERTALVLTPLAYAFRDRPLYIVLEQVPPVLPVWEASAVVLRELGYSVVTGLLNAEQYGVPQTRKRAILIARRDGTEAAMPTPTHSKYYNRDPERLDEGVLPWVSMAEALGWGVDEVVGFARRADGKGVATENGYRARDLRPAGFPAQNLTEKARSWSRERASTSERVTFPEATTLQSYPPIEWKGSRTRQFLMVGNAVPPLLGKAILETLIAK